MLIYFYFGYVFSSSARWYFHYNKHTHTQSTRREESETRAKWKSNVARVCTDTAQSGYWLPKVFYFIYITLQLSLCVLIHYDRLALMPSIFVARLLPLLLLLRRRRLLLLFTLQFTVLLAHEMKCARMEPRALFLLSFLDSLIFQWQIMSREKQ